MHQSCNLLISIFILSNLNLIEPTDLDVSDQLSALKYLKQNSVTVIAKRTSYSEAEKSNSDCDKYKCFNPLQCQIDDSKQISYYIYPPLTIISPHDDVIYDTKSMTTSEYWEILQSLLNKNHRVTSDPNQACIFVPSIDLDWLSQTNISLLHEVYDNLPYWRFVDGQPGTNHLVITLNPMPKITNLMRAIGRSMLVSSTFDTWTTRSSFDYSIPAILESQSNVGDDETRWKLVFTQYSSLDSRLKESVKRLERRMNGDFLTLGYRCDEDKYQYSKLEHLECDKPDSELEKLDKTTCRCTKDGLLGLRFPNLLSSAQYCLILHVRDSHILGETSHYLLSQALMRGCVPIISSDFILPLNDIIEWSKIVIPLTNSYSLDGLETLISSIPLKTYLQMRAEACKTWRMHFNSTFSLVDDLLVHYDSIVYPRIVLHSFQPN